MAIAFTTQKPESEWILSSLWFSLIQKDKWIGNYGALGDTDTAKQKKMVFPNPKHVLKDKNHHHSNPAWHTSLRGKAGFTHRTEKNILHIHLAETLTCGSRDRLHNPGANSQ